ncbi:hypothetical protein Syun_030731 [Stephania yunnanensis]|uniref:Uncharacterized protein n=1 Tax=Stephania yunnanensis TaxID=152371 RepID=A0AAP0E381_9MAGN
MILMMMLMILMKLQTLQIPPSTPPPPKTNSLIRTTSPLLLINWQRWIKIRDTYGIAIVSIDLLIIAHSTSNISNTTFSSKTVMTYVIAILVKSVAMIIITITHN